MSSTGKLRTYEGAVVIVTGGASGIGRALSEALAERGATVTIADRQTDLGEETAARIRAVHGHATATALDVTDFEAMERVVRQVVNEHGRLDYFFNNAGIGIGGEIREYRIEDWNQVLAVDINGVVNGVQAAYPVMVRQGFGHIVNTASMAGLMPTPLSVAYGTAKHAVVGLSTSLRIEAAPLGVRVSALCPGVIRTPILTGGKYGKMLRQLPAEIQEKNWRILRPMDPVPFARQVLRAVAYNRAIIVLPTWWKAIWWANRLSPDLGLWISNKLYEWAKKNWDAAPKYDSAGAKTIENR